MGAKKFDPQLLRVMSIYNGGTKSGGARFHYTFVGKERYHDVKIFMSNPRGLMLMGYISMHVLLDGTVVLNETKKAKNFYQIRGLSSVL